MNAGKNKFTTKTLAAMGLLTALSILLTRLCSISVTPSVRISLGGVPIILAGLLLGPAPGALVGFAADLLGTLLLSAYGWYPPLAVAPMLTGLLPGLLGAGLLKELTYPRVLLTALPAAVLGSMLWSTYWLHLLYGTSFAALLAVRAPIALLTAAAESAVVFGLLKAKIGQIAGVISRR